MLSKKNTKLFVIAFFIIFLLILTPNNPVAGRSMSVDIENTITTPNATLAQLSYDSGWYFLGVRPDPISIPFVHNLGGNVNEYLIDLVCWDSTLGAYECADHGFTTNAHWYNLTNTSISVYVQSARPDYIRVRIYKPISGYDSGWYYLGVRPDPISIPFVHNVGGNVNEYLVDLVCWDYSLGIYDCVDNGFNTNAHWYNLSDIGVSVYVQSSQPVYISMRIHTPIPAFKSGWYPLGVRPDPISIPITHNVGGDIGDYLVKLVCWDGSLGIYNCADNGFVTNAHWYDLTTSSIKVYAAGGSRPDSISVLIWKRPDTTYLPLIIR